MNIFLFPIQLLFFLIVSIILFTIPGFFLLKKISPKFSFWEKLILGTILGFTFFTLLSYLLFIMKLPFLLLPLILVIDLITLVKIKEFLGKPTLLPIKSLFFLILIFSLGIVGQLLIISPSGIYQNGDLVFWSSHGHDSLWHISLMEEYQKGFPLKNPSFSGEKLVNYHFFSDIAPSEFNRYFQFSPLDLYFRFFPLIFSILLGGMSYLLGKKLGNSYSAGIWAVIFTYFCGTFGFIVTFLQSRTIGGESLFWASAIQSSIGNPPQIIALILVLAFLYLFSFLLKDKSKTLLIICGLLVGSLAGFKIYGALVILISIFLVGFWQLFKERKIDILILSLLGSIIALLIYLPSSSGIGSFLIFEPWWFIRTLIVAPDRLNLIDWELRRQTYISESNWKRVAQIEITGFLIFFFGNLGMRFLGLFSFIGILKSSFTNYLNMILVFIICISFILPLLFLQKGVAANTIQFLQYFELILGILAGITVSKILAKTRPLLLSAFLITIIILLSIPTQVSLINSFYNRLPITKIDSEEFLALDFLKRNTPENSTVLTPAYNKYLVLNDPTPHIWDWSDTSYIAALSERKTYLSDTEQLDIMGYDLKDRQVLQNDIFNTEDPNELINKVKNNNINYLYFPKPMSPKSDLSKTSLEKVFSNSLIEIWKVQ